MIPPRLRTCGGSEPAAGQREGSSQTNQAAPLASRATRGARRGCIAWMRGVAIRVPDRPNRCSSWWSGHLRIRDCPAKKNRPSPVVVSVALRVSFPVQGRLHDERYPGRKAKAKEKKKKDFPAMHMRFERRLSRKPFLCFSGHWRQDTAQDKGPGLICPVCCVTKDPWPLWAGNISGLRDVFRCFGRHYFRLARHGAERDTVNGAGTRHPGFFMSSASRWRPVISAMPGESVCVCARLESAEQRELVRETCMGDMPIKGYHWCRRGWGGQAIPIWGLEGQLAERTGLRRAMTGLVRAKVRVLIFPSSPSQHLVWQRSNTRFSHDRHHQKQLM